MSGPGRFVVGPLHRTLTYGPIGKSSYRATLFSRSNVNPDDLLILVSLHILILGIGTYETELFLKSLRGDFLLQRYFVTGYVLRRVVITIFLANRPPHHLLLCLLGR